MVDHDTDRNDKIGKIIRYSRKFNQEIQLKVCWQRDAGRNCSNCEKCYRTIMSIIANHGDPNEYGFYVQKDRLIKIRNFLEQNTVNLGFWKTIQCAYQKEFIFWKDIPEVAWILGIRLNSPIVYLRKLKRRLFR
jgi:hypothetical protein